MKKEIRVLGIDDGPFDKFKDRKCMVVGTVFRGGSYPDGIMSTEVKVDGADSTSKLASMINRSKFKPQLRAVMLNGIALGGFNVVDLAGLSKKTGIPAIAVARRYPDFGKIRKALLKIRKKAQLKLIENAGKPAKAGSVWIQFKGIALQDAREIIKITSTRSKIPEPIRVAHLIASGIVKGESRGDA